MVPINLMTTDGMTMRNDNSSAYAAMDSGNGTTMPEIYHATRDTDPTNSTPITGGESLVLRNAHTGSYCR